MTSVNCVYGRRCFDADIVGMRFKQFVSIELICQVFQAASMLQINNIHMNFYGSCR